MKAAFSVEGEGFDQEQDQDQENLLQRFIEYIQVGATLSTTVETRLTRLIIVVCRHSDTWMREESMFKKACKQCMFKQ